MHGGVGGGGREANPYPDLPASCHPARLDDESLGLSVNVRELDLIDPSRSIRGNNTCSAPLVR